MTLLRFYMQILLALLCAIGLQAETQAERTIAGWVEDVTIGAQSVRVRAKVDTGAQHSSINAKQHEVFERHGKQWVRFELATRYGETVTVEQPVVRNARVKRHFAEAQQRPVIEMDICLGGVKKTVEVNLADRSRFEYQVLVGRSFLNGDFLVDPGRKDLLPPQC